MIKMDGKGHILWKKNYSDSARTAFKVISIPGMGYAILGWYSPSDYTSTICVYDYDGNVLLRNTFISAGWNGYLAPFDMLRLSSGNFVVAGGDEANSLMGYIKIFNSNLQLITEKAFSPPNGYYNCTFYGMCEQPDGNIALMARTVSSLNYPPEKFNLVVIRITPDGDSLSRTFLADTNYFQTANGLVRYGNGLLAVTGGKTNGINDGTSLSHTKSFNSTGFMLSGRINLVLFDATGNFISRKPITGYPESGMINSIHETSDGGFILCGTVDQLNYANMVSFTKMYLVKLDANLDVQWQEIIDSEYPSYGVDALPSGDGGYIVTGHIKSLNKKYEMTAIKTDANGKY